MKKGTQVSWWSQAGGSLTKKVGKIVEVVPANRFPNWDHYPGHNKIDGGGLFRNHTSYLVEVPQPRKRKPKLYWPLVKHLVEVIR